MLRIPSVSADSKYSSAVNEMAKAVAENLKAIGADNVQLLPTQGYPVVYADKIINLYLNLVFLEPISCSPTWEKSRKHNPEG